MQARLKQDGFSLIELMVTVALLGLLASFAIPSYQQMIQNSMIGNATNSIVNGFQVARGEAVSRNKPVQLELSAGTSSAWTVCVRPTPAGACATGLAADMIETREESEGSSGNITVNESQAGPYVFDGFGVLTSHGALTIDVDSTVTSIASRNLRVLIGVGGAVKSCDPSSKLDEDDPRRCILGA